MKSFELFVSSSPRAYKQLSSFRIRCTNDEPDRDLLSRPTNYLIIKFFHPPPPLAREERAGGCRSFGPFTMISLFYGGCVRRPLGIPCKRAMKAISTRPLSRHVVKINPSFEFHPLNIFFTRRLFPLY